MKTVFCDYCKNVATHFMQRGDHNHRSFACREHSERALQAVDANGIWLDPPINDQIEKRLCHERTVRLWRASARQAMGLHRGRR